MADELRLVPKTFEEIGVVGAMYVSAPGFNSLAQDWRVGERGPDFPCYLILPAEVEPAPSAPTAAPSWGDEWRRLIAEGFSVLMYHAEDNRAGFNIVLGHGDFYGEHADPEQAFWLAVAQLRAAQQKEQSK